MLYNRTLFIHPIYTRLHLVIPNSQSFPPPTPRNTILFYLWVCFCFVDMPRSSLIFNIRINPLPLPINMICDSFLSCQECSLSILCYELTLFWKIQPMQYAMSRYEVMNIGKHDNNLSFLQMTHQPSWYNREQLKIMHTEKTISFFIAKITILWHSFSQN